MRIYSIWRKFLRGGIWIARYRSPTVWLDVIGKSPYWIKAREDGKIVPHYDKAKAGDLCRYLRNKWAHFFELDP